MTFSDLFFLLYFLSFLLLTKGLKFSSSSLCKLHFSSASCGISQFSPHPMCAAGGSSTLPQPSFLIPTFPGASLAGGSSASTSIQPLLSKSQLLLPLPAQRFGFGDPQGGTGSAGVLQEELRQIEPSTEVPNRCFSLNNVSSSH